MKINLFLNYKEEIKFDYKKIISDIEKGIKDEKEISLILVDLEEIKTINLQYRGLDYPTDVISFEEEDNEDELYLGDIFVCIDKVYMQAESYNHSNEREFAFLVVHGILHLSGYDHMNDEEEKKMFDKQEEILESLNYRR
ncbi:MAG: rRNA maturation RNase YbeY [Bacilli bacterium]|nr:rRNA maturation RNase YbeY [Bacilli bacterium]